MAQKIAKYKTLRSLSTSVSKNLKNLYDYKMKFIIVGRSCVGKTTLLRKIFDPEFDLSNPTEKKYQSTIALDMLCKKYTIESNPNIHNTFEDYEKYVKVEAFDTAGMDDLTTLLKMYYRNAIGILLVYDINDRNSFDVVKKIHQKMMNDISKNINPKFLLIGCKLDLASMKREILFEEGQSFAFENKMLFTETSNYSELDINVEQNIEIMLRTICNEIMEHSRRTCTNTYEFGVKENPMKESDRALTQEQDNIIRLRSKSNKNTNSKMFCPISFCNFS
jgi:small GTP-binding protein